MQQVLECKEAVLREAEKEILHHRSEHLSLRTSIEDLRRRLADSIQVNNELVEKMAFIAELQQLDTLRGRLADFQRSSLSPRNHTAKTNERMSPTSRPKPKETHASTGKRLSVSFAENHPTTPALVKTPLTNMATAKSTCWQSVQSQRSAESVSSAVRASDSPYPSPLAPSPSSPYRPSYCAVR